VSDSVYPGMFRPLIDAGSLTLILAVGLMGQTSTPATALSFTNQAIESLREVSGELNDAVKSFNLHLDEAIARHDRGYRSQGGLVIPGADVDLNSGPADLMWTATRKFAAFRMLAARNDAYEPGVLADLDRIERLVLETRKRVDASVTTPRRLLVIAVADLDPYQNAVLKARHGLLLRVRAAAEESARVALLALPIEDPEGSSPDERAQKAWEGLGRGSRAPTDADSAPRWIPELNPGVSPQRASALPIRPERRKRVLLVNEPSYRMAMTDSGIEDGRGRHVFYQEEWVQRGASVVRYRWRVAVETATGEHILLKRYPRLELLGSLEDLYSRRDRDYVWYLEPPDDSTEPRRDEVESAQAAVARSREGIHAAALKFNAGIRDALARQDKLHTAANEPPVDGGLPDGMRQTLFAIRAHLARVPAVFESEADVRLAIVKAEMAVRDLEPLAAWANRAPKAHWAQLLDRSDREIDSVRAAETEALISLPPDSLREEDSFPALEKNVIIRIRRTASHGGRNSAVRCLQEVWRMESGMPGTHEVRRTVSLILVDPRTGNQTAAGVGTAFYKAAPENLLEEIFDEYAADEVTMGS
jgi:hypothetical protein